MGSTCILVIDPQQKQSIEYRDKALLEDEPGARYAADFTKLRFPKRGSRKGVEKNVILKVPSPAMATIKKNDLIGTDQPAPNSPNTFGRYNILFLVWLDHQFVRSLLLASHHHQPRSTVNTAATMAHPQSAFASPQSVSGASVFSALNIIWLLHAALEGPIAFIGLFLTRGLSFKDEITNTMAVIIKVRTIFPPLFPHSFAFAVAQNYSLSSFDNSYTHPSRSHSRSSASSSTACPTIFPENEPPPYCCCSTTALRRRYCSMPNRLSTLAFRNCWQSTVSRWNPSRGWRTA